MDLAMIEQCAPAVDAVVMQSIVKVESAGRAHVIGYHITKDGRAYRLPYQPKDTTQAAAWAKWLMDNGYRFDAGVAQVNSQHFSRLGLDAESVFDACKNVGAGAQIFNEFYGRAYKQYRNQATALNAAISAYQTGSFTRGFGTGYVSKVGVALRGGGLRPSSVGGGDSLAEAKAAPTAVSFTFTP